MSTKRSFICRPAAVVGILLAEALVQLVAASSSAVEPLNALDNMPLAPNYETNPELEQISRKHVYPD